MVCMWGELMKSIGPARILILFILIAPLAPSAHGQKTVAMRSTPPTRRQAARVLPSLKLTKLDGIHFPIPAPMAISDWTACDAAGNVYLLYSPFVKYSGSGPMPVPDVMDRPVIKLGVQSQDTTQYTARPEGLPDGYLPAAYSVDNLGDVFRLFLQGNGALPSRGPEVVKYDHDGGIDSITRLRLPHRDEIMPANFFAFSNGNLLLTGILYPRPVRRSPLASPRKNRAHLHIPPSFRPFTGIFDNDGALIAELRLPQDVIPNKNNDTPVAPSSGPDRRRYWPMEMVGTLFAHGPDDTAYLLRPRWPAVLYTISDNGRVLRRATLRGTGVNHLHPNLIGAAGASLVFVNYIGVSTTLRHTIKSVNRLVIFNSVSGKAIESYDPPTAGGYFLACAANARNFTYLGSSKHGNLEIFDYTKN